MHLELNPHPHPHPHPEPRARRGLLPWVLILAMVALAGFLALRRGSPLSDFHEGVGLLEQYNYAAAFKKFSAVVRAQPEWDAAHFNRGLAALNLREEHLRTAEDELREALRLNARNLHAQFCLGILYRHEQRLDEALRCFEIVARADPTDPHALYEYGASLMDHQKVDEARAALEAAVRLQPAFASAIYRLSRIYLVKKEMDRFQEALKTFRALEAGKQGIVSGEIYGEGGKYALAIRDPLPPGNAAQSPASRSPAPPPETVPPETVPAVEAVPMILGIAAPTRPRPDGSPVPPPLALGDLDADGTLDLVLGGQSTPAGVRAEVWKGEKGGAAFARAQALDADGAALSLGDLDGDSDLDLLLVEEGAWRLFENDGKAAFAASKMTLPPMPAGFPVEALLIDADSDWDVDILVICQKKEGERVETVLALLNNNRDGTFTDLAGPAAIARLPLAAREVLAGDLDLDIDLDLLLLPSGAGEPLVLINDRASRYRRAPAKDLGALELLLERAGVPEGLRASLVKPGAAAGESAALFRDAAGRPMTLRARPGEPARLTAQPAPRSWIGFELNGPREPQVGVKWANLTGIGATLEVRAGEQDVLKFLEARAGERAVVQALTGFGLGGARGPYQAYLDLGSADRIDYVRILWPDGVLQSELALVAGKLHRIEEIQRKPTSCPIVFVWDGDEFRYVADLLGVGGLGYLEAPGSYSRPDPTEVLELPALVPYAEAGGEPELLVRIVEPLEECTYLDAVELVAVDAPPGLTVHPHELFAVRAPAPGAELLLFREALAPSRALDHRGKEVTAELREVDRLYPEGWSRDRRFPGAAEAHAVVLEWDRSLPVRSGPAGSGEERPILFLHGYVEYSYSTSNFAAAQARVSLHPPTVSVEREGRWVPLREEWGFPAGTPRWMAVDLGGLLRPGDRRLRIDTDMEIYWDQAFLAGAAPLPLGEIGRRGGSAGAHRAEAGGQARLTVLGPDRAELRFLGFPDQGSPDGRHPGLYRYDEVEPSVTMKPFPGLYTAYGPVEDLVRTADDRFALFGEGDEVALAFRASRLPALPDGWKRTFFLAAVGYCKDMDLYTAASATVEPLPFRSMSSYPPPAGEPAPPEVGRIGERTRRVEPLTLGAGAGGD